MENLYDQLGLIGLLIIVLMFRPSLDINKITGDLLLWYTFNNRRYYIILIYNFYKSKK